MVGIERKRKDMKLLKTLLYMIGIFIVSLFYPAPSITFFNDNHETEAEEDFFDTM